MKKELKIFNDLVAALLKAEKSVPVTKLCPPEEMSNKFDLAVRDEPLAENEFRALLEKIVLNTPKTASRSFFNQLFGGRIGSATLGELLTVMLNVSMYTYKVGGPHIGIERELIQQVGLKIGYGEGEIAGTFAPGGSMSNFMSVIMARDAADSTIKNQGARKHLIIYTSSESHYSIAKNASFSGIGRENVRYIPVDDHARMDVASLEKAIVSDKKRGFHPCMINATAGTTVMGAFDDIAAISQVAKKYGLWLHVDGAYYGSVIFSNKYKHFLAGVEHSDSFTMNPHKTLGTPLSCSLFITKHKNQLVESFSEDASYLYQADSDDYNPGKTSIQCGRRNDAFKFWTLWKSVGTKGLGDIIDRLFALADFARHYVRKHPDYTLYSFDNSTAVCFNYKGISAETICNDLSKYGKLMVSHGSFNGQTFVRFVTVNSRLKEKDIIRFFKNFESFAERYV